MSAGLRAPRDAVSDDMHGLRKARIEVPACWLSCPPEFRAWLVQIKSKPDWTPPLQERRRCLLSPGLSQSRVLIFWLLDFCLT